MRRTLPLVVAVLASLSVTLLPAVALACDGDCGDCPGKAKAAKAQPGKAAPKEKAGEKSAPAAKEAKPSEQSSLLDEVDQVLAAKCSCKGPGDCTCKKGECKCPACGPKARPYTRVIESLRGVSESPVLPANARVDATAGVFI